MLNPGILIPFLKLLSIRREINFCLDVLLPSSLRADAAGTPFLLPSRGARAAGTGGGKSASLQVSMMEAWTIRKRKRKKAAFVEGNKLCSRPAGCSLGLSAVCTLSREGERRERNVPIAPCSLPVWPGTDARQWGSTRFCPARSARCGPSALGLPQSSVPRCLLQN